MSFKFKYKSADEADLDVTSFMNLMIVLVPVLLLSMTFTQITVLDIELPELTGGSSASDESQSQLEVHLTENGFDVFYPSNTSIAKIPMLESNSKDKAQVKTAESSKKAMVPSGNYDFKRLSAVMREIKKQLQDKKEVVLLSAPGVDYQNLVFSMETIKSYKTTIAASVVEIELFPEISLGDTK